MNRTPSNSNRELTAAIEALVAEVQVLRMAVDELAEELQWGNQNRRDSVLQAGRTIRSCSLDPTSSDFQVNSVLEETISKLRADLPPLSNGSGPADGNSNGDQRQLFG